MKSPLDMVLERVKLPFVGSLHPYQTEDINKAIATESFGLYLDLGLGKTTCSILIACGKLLLEDFHSCFVLVPATLITQWMGVLQSMEISCVAYQGSPKERKQINREVDFVVMSHEIFRNDYDILKKTKAYLIIDEATLLCNPQNITHKMLQGGETRKQLPPKPGRIKPEFEVRKFDKFNNGSVLLTATPINKPEDAYGLIKITSPDIYRNYNQFKRIHIASENPFGGVEEYAELPLLMENLLRNASLRHTTDHLELPPIIFKTINYELAPEHKKLYDDLVNKKMLELKTGETIAALDAMKLYHWCQKLILNPDEVGYTGEVVGLDLLDRYIATVKQYIICCNYVMSNDKMMGRYKTGGSYGKVGAKEKSDFIEEFKAGRLKGLTIHPKSGGVGLDLPMCQQVAVPELPVTPRDFRQVCGRVWRQGQKETVVITVFVALKTIQQTLFKRLLDKDDLSREVVRTPSALRGDLLSEVNYDTGVRTRDQLFKDLRGVG